MLRICISMIVMAAAIAGAEPQTQLQQAVTGRIVLAAVVDRTNRPLVAVGPDDFAITEAGQPREVLDVHVADYPVVVLVDDAADSAELPAMKAAVSRFVARVGERPVALGTLSKPDALVASFDDERGELLKRIDAISAIAQAGGTLQSGAAAALSLAAVASAARLLQEAAVPFSAIVIATAHPIGTAAQVAPAVVASILDSGANVQVVIARRPGEAIETSQADLLRVLAAQTRGQYTPIFSGDSYAIALDRIADRMATELMIQYVAPAGAATGDVKVGARIPGARVVGLGVK
jgi:hypothetical protein